MQLFTTKVHNLWNKIALVKLTNGLITLVKYISYANYICLCI